MVATRRAVVRLGGFRTVHDRLRHADRSVCGPPVASPPPRRAGRLMKVMLQGTDALWGLWVGFFRDHLASFISLLVLLPISLFINWRLALLLIALCVVFAGLTALIVRKTETLQSSVERHYSDPVSYTHLRAHETGR